MLVKEAHVYDIDLTLSGFIKRYSQCLWSWWRHQMETFSTSLALCAGNSPGPVNSPHKGQWRRALMFSLICARINDWVNNREADDLRRHRGHYDVSVMASSWLTCIQRFMSAYLCYQLYYHISILLQTVTLFSIYLGDCIVVYGLNRTSKIMTTSSNGNIFRVTGDLCGEFTSLRWFPRKKFSDAELWCFLWSTSDETVEKTIVRLVIWDAIAPIMTSL